MSLQITPARSLVTINDGPYVFFNGAHVRLGPLSDYLGTNPYFRDAGVLDLSGISASFSCNFIDCALRNGFYPWDVSILSDGSIYLDNCGLTNDLNFDCGQNSVSVRNNLGFVPTAATLGVFGIGPGLLTLVNIGSISFDATFAFEGSQLAIQECASLVSVGLYDDAVTKVGISALVSNNPLLTEIDITNLVGAEEWNFGFSDNALTAANVDEIFNHVDSLAPATPGTINVSGGTSAAPTAASLAARTALAGGGWTITTN